MVLNRVGAAACLVAVCLSGQTADIPVTAQVSSTTVPPGATAQITIALANPISFTQGKFQVDLDPAVFGAISAIQIFSASGDQQGVARIKGTHADVTFAASSGTIGALPNLPVAQITATLTDSAPIGQQGAVAVSTATPWRAANGDTYIVSFHSPGVTVGSGMAIESVVPGGGAIPAGTTVTINGAGFSDSTSMALADVAWSGLQVVSPSQITFIVDGTTDLQGKKIILSDANGSSTTIYSVLTPALIDQWRPSTGYWPIFPLSKATSGSGVNGLWLLNDTADAIDVTLSGEYYACTPCHWPPPPRIPITIPAQTSMVVPPLNGNFIVTTFGASAPLRSVAALRPNVSPLPDWPPPTGATYAPISDPITINYCIGDPLPSVFVQSNYGGVDITSVTVGTEDGADWLSASPENGGAMLTVNASRLGLGSHHAVLMETLKGVHGFWLAPVIVNISEKPVIEARPYPLSVFVAPYESASNLTITSSSAAVPVRIRPSHPWLRVSTDHAVTPVTVAVSATVVPGSLQEYIIVEGPGNSLNIPVRVQEIGVSLKAFNFLAPVNSTTPLTGDDHTLSFPLEYTVALDPNAPWLSAAILPADPADSYGGTLRVRADPTGLAVGVYWGLVTLNQTYGRRGPYLTSLTIWNDPAPPIALSSDYVDLRTGSNLLTVSTPAGVAPFSISFKSDNPSAWISTSSSGLTPSTFTIIGSAKYPGTYHGTMTINMPPGSTNSVDIPVVFTVPPSLPSVDWLAPRISTVVDTASLSSGPIAVGQKLSVFGLFPVLDSIDATGFDAAPTQLYAARVLINGIPAPLQFVSRGRIDLIVPDAISGNTTAEIKVECGGIPSEPRVLPVTPP